MVTVGQRGQVNPSEVRPGGGPFAPAPHGGGAATVTPSKPHQHSGAGAGAPLVLKNAHGIRLKLISKTALKLKRMGWVGSSK